MRGASALQKVFEKRPDMKLKVLVVWMPVVRTDIAPPTKGVLGLLRDARATQFWDKTRLTSEAILRAAKENPRWIKPEDHELCEGEPVVWDFVALFPEEARWDVLIPKPDFYGFPVVDSIEGLERRLNEIAASSKNGTP